MFKRMATHRLSITENGVEVSLYGWPPVANLIKHLRAFIINYDSRDLIYERKRLREWPHIACP